MAAGTPDTQPGIFEIMLAPSSGSSYVGIHSGKGFLEGIGQQLPHPLQKDSTYTIGFDLAYTSYYLYPACYGNLAIYGGYAPGDTAELLWSSGSFTHEDWQSYHAIFHPASDYTYISFWAYPVAPCNKSQYTLEELSGNIPYCV